MTKLENFIKDNKGFTLIEVLIALFCLSFALLLFVGVCSVLQHFPTQGTLQDDVIAIRQLRMILVQSDNVQVDPDSLSFHYHGKDYVLKEHRQRLVKSPGYEIFLKDINDSEFYEQGGCIYVSWNRNKKQDALLYCE